MSECFHAPAALTLPINKGFSPVATSGAVYGSLICEAWVVDFELHDWTDFQLQYGPFYTIDQKDCARTTLYLQVWGYPSNGKDAVTLENAVFTGLWNQASGTCQLGPGSFPFPAAPIFERLRLAEAAYTNGQRLSVGAVAYP
jgi:hypothetical protein